MQTSSLTRMPSGAAVIARNTDLGRRDSIAKRSGYRRWRDIDMAAPITLITVIATQILTVAGNVDVRDA